MVKYDYVIILRIYDGMYHLRDFWSRPIDSLDDAVRHYAILRNNGYECWLKEIHGKTKRSVDPDLIKRKLKEHSLEIIADNEEK